MRRPRPVTAPATTDRPPPECLGGRRFGQTWRERAHPDDGGRAVRHLDPARFSAAALARLWADLARWAGLAGHDHRVAIFPPAEGEAGPYYAMTFVPGGLLLDRLAGRGWKDVARYAPQVAEALQAPHDHGLVHNEVVPANILYHDATDRAVLGAPGLAAYADGAAHPVVVPGYAAPEVGTGGRPAAAWDVFALAATLYHYVTGAAPFRTTSLADSLADAGADRRPLRHTLRDCSRVLRETILRGLEADPARRPDLPELLPWLQAGRWGFDLYLSGRMPHWVVVQQHLSWETRWLRPLLGALGRAPAGMVAATRLTCVFVARGLRNADGQGGYTDHWGVTYQHTRQRGLVWIGLDESLFTTEANRQEPDLGVSVLDATVLEEFAHAWDFRLQDDGSPWSSANVAWLRAIEDPDTGRMRRFRIPPVPDYDPDEDVWAAEVWAAAIVWYCCQPDVLRRENPALYQFVERLVQALAEGR